jgi:hypothetical protein
MNSPSAAAWLARPWQWLSPPTQPVTPASADAAPDPLKRPCGCEWDVAVFGHHLLHLPASGDGQAA